ncbi:hypothetical protein, partial [Nocardia shimofusensis]|uniref:hypothetical protein n=1 Tax=Nocardia shimofusensis TaxID=228596 RepID=UPI001C3FB1BC
CGEPRGAEATMLPKREKNTTIRPYPIQRAPLSAIERTREAMRKAWPELDHTPMSTDSADGHPPPTSNHL